MTEKNHYRAQLNLLQQLGPAPSSARVREAIALLEAQQPSLAANWEPLNHALLLALAREA